jgi:hypothetical protein
MASTIAAMSTAKDISTTGCPRMKRRPSSTERSPGRITSPTGGSDGSRSAA